MDRKIIKTFIILLFIIFTNGPIQSQNEDSVILILKNDQKNYILNPFINIDDNIITKTNIDTLIIKASFVLDDTVFCENGTILYHFRKRIKPKERVRKTIFINPQTSLCKIIKFEIIDEDKKYIYYFRSKRKKYKFYKLEIIGSVSDSGSVSD